MWFECGATVHCTISCALEVHSNTMDRFTYKQTNGAKQQTNIGLYVLWIDVIKCVRRINKLNENSKWMPDKWEDEIKKGKEIQH